MELGDLKGRGRGVERLEGSSNFFKTRGNLVSGSLIFFFLSFFLFSFFFFFFWQDKGIWRFDKNRAGDPTRRKRLGTSTCCTGVVQEARNVGEIR